MTHQIKEHRSRARCSKCDNILHGGQSQRRGICRRCEFGSFVNEPFPTWQNRLSQLLKEEIDFKDDTLAEFFNREIQLKGARELEEFFRQKVL